MKQSVIVDDLPLPFPIAREETMDLRKLIEDDGYGTVIEQTGRWERVKSLESRGWVKLTWAQGIRAWMVVVTLAGRNAVGQDGYQQ